MAYQLVTLERDGNIAVLTLNRPDKRNALNTALRDEVRAALEELEADDSVAVAIITGAGPVFCAGFDTSEFATIPPAEVFHGESAVRYHHRLQHFAKPLVAAINGSAMGGGFDIAVLADVRICIEGASFGHPEIKFGAPTLFGPLAAVIGGGLARDLCLSGRRIDASEAYRIGLVSQVVAPGRLLEEAKAAARVIAEAPVATLKEVKSQIIAAAPTHFPER
ncbi:MAG: enoyl-CoA hydratase/isomerase family protein [Dehalococcoidia bacterium]|nr:enoyl-CoA hydratase/isomerase family protein [Dehalococcoidia bacterium]NUQ56566.1 enoyl-CoA hydratase/isomerase family protein [Dehalococcoidia bacterium]